MSKKEYRDEMDNDSDSVKSFEKKYLTKTKDPKDLIVFNETYESYKIYCQREKKNDMQVKNDFKEQLMEMGYKIKNSSRRNNKVCIFNVKMNQEKGS
jgi:hypothetical protein